MAFKRKLCVEEIEGEAENKRARMGEDRLSKLPDDLKLRILSSLHTKETFKTSILSKIWVSLWRLIPVLDFNDDAFHNIYVFYKFVKRVLCLRDASAKLDRLTFTQRVGVICGAKVLNNVFDYAFSHGVKKFEADIYMVNTCNHTWPVCLNSSFESLTSFKLQSGINIGCPFLGPRSRSFKNLTDLYLKRAIITDVDPFSGFPVLERLTLVNCDIRAEGETLSVHACNLSDLTISGNQNFKYCKLTTPRLRFFEYRGYSFLPLFLRHTDLHVLDTMVISCSSYLPYEKKMFDNLHSLFCTLGNVKSLTLFLSTVEILSSFTEELAKRTSPFRNLKCLKLNFGYDVEAYLLQDSPGVEVKYI